MGRFKLVFLELVKPGNSDLLEHCQSAVALTPGTLNACGPQGAAHAEIIRATRAEPLLATTLPHRQSDSATAVAHGPGTRNATRQL